MDYYPGNCTLIGETQRGKHIIRRYVLPNQWQLEVRENGLVESLIGVWHPNHFENIDSVRNAIGWVDVVTAKGRKTGIATNFK
ncbi:MAG: hypothetical protein MH825_08115 [Cyanobacteria bacterium]|nr:hypothetical protein [Cyanobacteriota bacterium]